jgi:hypothetical protein
MGISIDWAVVLPAAQTFLLAILAGLGVVISKYLEEKTKNLATKQDVGEITAQIESIKTQYAKRSLVHKLSFEKEFEILSELWRALVELRGATLNLRPVFDHYDLKETEEERKQKRLSLFGEKFNTFAGIVDKNRPFYPQKIYQVLFDILMIAKNEAIEFSYPATENQRPDRSYWDNAQKNHQVIVEKIDQVCDLIRQRIVA